MITFKIQHGEDTIDVLLTTDNNTITDAEITSRLSGELPIVIKTATPEAIQAELGNLCFIYGNQYQLKLSRNGRLFQILTIDEDTPWPEGCQLDTIHYMPNSYMANAVTLVKALLHVVTIIQNERYVPC